MLRAANVSSVPQRSPFRYPGGKTWLIPQVRQWLRSKGGSDIELIEPFAGGAIVSLTSVMEGLVGSATLVERDENVAAVWRTVLGRNGRRLADQIMDFTFSEDNVRLTLESTPMNTCDLAFQTILRNRVNRNGILAARAGMLKKGEAGYGLKSRWYPGTLADRILRITEVKTRMSFRNGDGLRYLKKRTAEDGVVYFIDPPYRDVGKRLYKHGEINHEKLFQRAQLLKGDFLMTYDHTEEILRLAEKYKFETQRIWMHGGLNNAKTELLISRSFDWLTGTATLDDLLLQSSSAISKERPCSSNGQPSSNGRSG